MGIVTKKFLAIVLSILILISSLIMFAFLSSYPTSIVVRKLFEGGVAIQPENYEDIAARVRVKGNLTYDSSEKMNTFDLFKPIHAEGNEPLIVWVHGGAFVGGDKQDIEEYAVQIANQGYVVASMNYQLAPEAKYPSPINQLGELLQYIEKNKNELEVNTDKLILTGDSAGAHIVSQFTMVQNDTSYAELLEIDPITNKGEIDAVILLCGPYDLQGLGTSLGGGTGIASFIANRLAWAYLGDRNWQSSELLSNMSIIKNVNNNFPKTFISDGNKGTFTEDGLAFRDQLMRLGVDVTDIFYDIDVEILEHEYQFKMNLESSQNTFRELIKFLDGI